MRTVETPSAVGTGWRRTLNQLYRTIAAVETSPMEILYDRVLQLEQEVSALKRSLLIGSVGLASAAPSRFVAALPVDVISNANSGESRPYASVPASRVG
jgi:hypothetical protein